MAAYFLARLRCMLMALPPTKVSSTSTSPPAPPPIFVLGLNDLLPRTSRIRWFINHADFWVILSVRAISALLTPFLQLTTIQKAVIHLSSEIGESSKIVPTLTLNCRLQPLQNHIRRVLRKECSVPLQRGHLITPSGQRMLTA